AATAEAARAAADADEAAVGPGTESARAGPASVSPATTATARPETTGRRPERRPGQHNWLRFPTDMSVRSGCRTGPLNAYDLKVSSEWTGLCEFRGLGRHRREHRQADRPATLSRC